MAKAYLGQSVLGWYYTVIVETGNTTPLFFKERLGCGSHYPGSDPQRRTASRVKPTTHWLHPGSSARCYTHHRTVGSLLGQRDIETPTLRWKTGQELCTARNIPRQRRERKVWSGWSQRTAQTAKTPTRSCKILRTLRYSRVGRMYYNRISRSSDRKRTKNHRQVSSAKNAKRKTSCSSTLLRSA